MKKKIVILSGAGISAESGIPTFRGGNGLWQGYDVKKVSSPQGWNETLVLEFYNERRKVASQAKPNQGHKILAELEEYFDVVIFTQNIDNLHEQAGSKDVRHLHGSIFQARSTEDDSLIYDIKTTLSLGDKCELGSQLRPNVVWFGESVPMISDAIYESMHTDFFYCSRHILSRLSCR